MKFLAPLIALLGLLVLASGCSVHNNSPLTPAIVGTTPTYRSTAKSTDLNIGPMFSQPGVNSGPPAPLPVIASQDRWDPNDPVATSVYTALSTDSSLQAHYLRVYAHKGLIWIQGKVPTKQDAERASEIAKSIKGVNSVRNDLKVAA